MQLSVRQDVYLNVKEMGFIIEQVNMYASVLYLQKLSWKQRMDRLAQYYCLFIYVAKGFLVFVVIYVIKCFSYCVGFVASNT